MIMAGNKEATPILLRESLGALMNITWSNVALLDQNEHSLRLRAIFSIRVLENPFACD